MDGQDNSHLGDLPLTTEKGHVPLLDRPTAFGVITRAAASRLQGFAMDKLWNAIFGSGEERKRRKR